MRAQRAAISALASRRTPGVVSGRLCARRRIRVRPPFVIKVAITRKYIESALL